jgi:hypothetical protein
MTTPSAISPRRPRDSDVARSVQEVLAARYADVTSSVDMHVSHGWVCLQAHDAIDRGRWDSLVRSVAALSGVRGVDDRFAARVVARVSAGVARN